MGFMFMEVKKLDKIMQGYGLHKIMFMGTHKIMFMEVKYQTGS